MAYDVVLLIEQQLSDADARLVYGLHEALEDPVRYHLLMPVEEAASRIEAGIASVGVGDGMVYPVVEIPESVQAHFVEETRHALENSSARLTALGAEASGTPLLHEPIGELTAKVAEVDAREAIIMTRSHIVAEFFHVDWTSRARRHLAVPVLHLLEHSA